MNPRCHTCDDIDDSYPCFFGCGCFCAACYPDHWRNKCRGPVSRPSLLDRALMALARWFT